MNGAIGRGRKIFAVFAAIAMIAVPLCSLTLDSDADEQYKSPYMLDFSKYTTSESFSNDVYKDTGKTLKQILEANGGTATFKEASSVSERAKLTLDGITLVTNNDGALGLHEEGLKSEICLSGINRISSADLGSNTRAISGYDVVITGSGTLYATAGSATECCSEAINCDKLTITGGAKVIANGSEATQDQQESIGIYAYNSLIISGAGTEVAAYGARASTSVGLESNSSITVIDGAKLTTGVTFTPQPGENGHGISLVNDLTIHDSEVSAIGTTVGVCRVFGGESDKVSIDSSVIIASGSNCAFNFEIKSGEITNCKDSSGEIIKTVPTTVTDFKCLPVGCFTVTFVNEKGDAPEPQTVRSGNTITEPDAPESSGYAFCGWYADGRLWNFETDTVSKDITLTAGWTEIQGGSAVVKTDASGNCEIVVASTVKTVTVTNGGMSLTFDESAVGSLAGKHLHVTLALANSEEAYCFVVTVDGEPFHGSMRAALPFDPSQGTPQVYLKSGSSEIRLMSIHSWDDTVVFMIDHSSTIIMRYTGMSPGNPNALVFVLVGLLALAQVGVIGICVARRK